MFIIIFREVEKIISCKMRLSSELSMLVRLNEGIRERNELRGNKVDLKKDFFIFF